MKVSPINNSFTNQKAKTGTNHNSNFNSDTFLKLLNDEISSDVFIQNTDPSMILTSTDTEIEQHIKAQKEYQEMQAQKEAMNREAEASKSQIEGIKKTFDILLACLKISSRIINGDNVPASDHQLLLENYPDMYSASMSARKIKDKPQDHDSVIEEDSDKEKALTIINNEVSRVLESTLSDIDSEN